MFKNIKNKVNKKEAPPALIVVPIAVVPRLVIEIHLWQQACAPGLELPVGAGVVDPAVVGDHDLALAGVARLVLNGVSSVLRWVIDLCHLPGCRCDSRAPDARG